MVTVLAGGVSGYNPMLQRNNTVKEALGERRSNNRGKDNRDKTENGAQVSTIAVDRILKTETIACEPYTKGYVEGLTLQVSANSLSQHLTLRLFLEEDQGAYRIIAADVVEDGQQPSLIDPGSTGLLMLIAMAVAVSQRPVITLDKKE